MKGLYVITDETLISADQLNLAVAQAINGGAMMVQYRNKSANAQQKLWEAQDLQPLCQGLGVPLIINDDMQLALESRADGVHLGKGDGDIAEARKLLGPHAIIGATCGQSIEAALEAQKQGASYVAFGRFFDSSTKPDAASASLETLKQAKDSLDIPIVAIGGITQENATPLIDAGADMLAVVHGVFGQASIQNAAQLLHNQFTV